MAEQIVQQTGGDILDAVQSGDVATVKKYLEEGVPVDLTDEAGWSLLHHAAALSQVEVITLLHEKGCSVDSVDNEGRTPLHYAATNEDIETIRLLAAMGSNVNSVDSDGNTPLQWSVMCEQYTAIEELIKHGGTVDNEELEPPTECAHKPVVIYHIHGSGELVREEIHPDTLATLNTETVIHNVGSHTELNVSHNCGSSDNHQTDPIATQPSKDTTANTTEQPTKDIFEAAQCGDTKTVKEYLDLGVPVDVTDEDGWSPVHHALAYRQVEVIRLLMDRGCLMNPVQKSKKTPQQRGGLHTTTECGSKNSAFNENPQCDNDVFEAARCGDTDAVKAYLDLGIPIDLTDEEGRTILHCAAGEGQIKVVELLVKRGCRIDLVDSNGWTPLDYAGMCGRKKTVQLFKQFEEGHKKQDITGTKDSEDEIGLFMAAVSGRIDMLEHLAEQGLNVNATDDGGRTPLHYAALRGQFESVRTLLRLGGQKSMTMVAGRLGTPLHQAVAEGHKDIVSFLLNEGCSSNLVDSIGRSLIHFAVAYGRIDILEILVKHGGDLNMGDDEDQTPLHFAARRGQFESVRTLLRLGGRKSMTIVAGRSGTPLHMAVAGGYKDIVSLLLNEGCPIDVVDSVGRSLIHFAVAYGHIDILEMLARHGGDINMADDEDQIPLHIAALRGQFESVRTLLRLGGKKSMTKVAESSGTPLHMAVAEGHKDIVSLLLNEGCPIDVVDSEGRGLIHIAVKHGQIDMMMMLAGQRLDVNMGDNRGMTPLHYAAGSGQLEVVYTLLTLGGKESMTKVAGIAGTPLHIAVGEGHKDVVSFLLSEGCPIDVVNNNGSSLIHVAITCDQIEMFEMLAEQGLDVNLVNNEGLTPLHLAAAKGLLKVVRTLLRSGGKESMTNLAGTAGTPLHLAVGNGHKDIVSLLLSEGCPIDVVTTEGRTAIHIAALTNQTDMIEILANQGLDVNLGDNEDMTPLHYAAGHDQLEVLHTLMTLGARESMTKVAGKAGTPLHIAVGEGNKDVVLFLLSEGCPIDVVNTNGSSLIHVAITCDQIDMIEMLAEQGLDVNIVDNEDLTPLHLAAANGLLKVVNTLLRLGGQESMTIVGGTAGTPLHQAVGIGHREIALLLMNEGCPIDVVDCRGRGLLHFAAQCGQTDMIEMFAERGLDVNFSDKQGITPLYSAAVSDQPGAIRTLLRLGGRESMTKLVKDGGTPLHVAVGKGHKDVVSLLLDEGCPSNIVDDNGCGLVHFAAQFGQIGMIKMLAGQELDVNVVDNKGRTPLHFAVVNEQLEAVRTLLRLGGRKSMTAVAGTSGTPLHQAVKQGFKDIASLLLKEGCPIDVVDGIGASLLHIASQYGQTELIEMLAEQGLDVNIANELDHDGVTPLHMAARFEQIEAVRTLLRLGAGKSMTKVAGDAGTPLHQAASNGRKDILSLLLNEGCPINVVDCLGRNIMYFASQFGQVSMIKYLVEKGMDVNKVDDHGWTPVHSAAYSGQLEVERTLLQLGGRRSMTKVAGIAGTPLHLAVEGGHKDVALFLLDEGCSISVVNSGGRTLIHTATQFGQTDMIEMLAEQELDVNVEDNDNMTPLHIAAVSGHLESVRTLLRLGGRKSMTKVAGSVGTPLHYAAVLGRSRVVSILLNEGCRQGMGARGAFNSDNFANIRSSQNITPLMWAVNSGHVTTFRELRRFGGDIRLSDDFGMNVSDWITLFQGGKMAKQFCEACGVRCDGEGILGVLSALITNKLLDINKVLCLAAVFGKVSTLEAMVSSQYPIDRQRMAKMPKFLSFITNGKMLPDQFRVFEEPLNPLHISLLSVYFIGENINVEFIEKLTSHKRTQYTVNELFPNGLSPLDVARQFGFSDIAIIIERAGGGLGKWADLPKDIEEKSITALTSLKELRGCALGDEATLRILSLLGIKVADDGSEVRKKILEGKPTIVLIDRHFLRRIKAKRKWKRVGRLLGIDEEVLSELSEEGDDDDDIYYSMLEHWVDYGHTVSWNTLFESVSGFEVKSTIDDIIDKIVEELSPSQVRN